MKTIYKSIFGVSAAAVIAAASLAPVLVNAWHDSAGGRPSYTLDQINNERVLDKDGKNIIVLNSILDGPNGDEKNFVSAKVAGANVETWNADTINVQDGETYTIRAFVHNNNPNGMDAVAKDVRARFSLPTTVAKSQDIVGYVSSSNATPDSVWDEVTLNSDQDFYLEYVDGSAKYNNKSQDGVERTFNLPNDIIISDTTLGYDTMNGDIPGCYGFSGFVTIDVKVHTSVAAKLTKMVRIKGTDKWSDSVDAKVGDEVEYQIEYVNLLGEQVNNVMIRDILPTNVEYVENSTYLINKDWADGVLLEDNTVTTSGINIGDYGANEYAYVRFTGKVVDKTMACGNNKLVNWANVTIYRNMPGSNDSTDDGTVYKDDASVFVVKDDETCKSEPTPTPTPKPTPTPDNPGSTPNYTVTNTVEMPDRIVDTGAGTIVTGAVGAGATVTTLGYYLASRKKLL